MLRNLFNSAVYIETYGLVKSYVLSRSGDEKDVKDTLQEGLCIFFSKAYSEEFELECNLSSYIFGICKNVWEKELKKRRKQNLFNTLEYRDISTMDNLEDKIKKDALQTILLRSIKKLSEKCQDVIDLQLEGMSCDEIAKELNYQDGNIAGNKLFTSKARLKVLVQKDPEYIRLFNSDSSSQD